MTIKGFLVFDLALQHAGSLFPYEGSALEVQSQPLDRTGSPRFFLAAPAWYVGP